MKKQANKSFAKITFYECPQGYGMTLPTVASILDKKYDNKQSKVNDHK
jgi:hypothetical protein